MNTRQSRYRLILVTGLIVAMGAFGVATPPVAISSCPVTVAKLGDQGGCCCAVMGGCHCDASCCQAPVPTQDRAPAPPKPTDESSLAPGLLGAANATIDSPAATNWHRLLADPPLASSLPSLFALSIRLNL